MATPAEGVPVGEPGSLCGAGGPRLARAHAPSLRRCLNIILTNCHYVDHCCERQRLTVKCQTCCRWTKKCNRLGAKSKSIGFARTDFLHSPNSRRFEMIQKSRALLIASLSIFHFKARNFIKNSSFSTRSIMSHPSWINFERKDGIFLRLQELSQEHGPFG